MKYLTTVFFILILASLGFAEETITITTYYPSPYGSYNDLYVANRLGIGTTGPGGKLDVNGTIYQRGSQIHADYVFEPDYKLEPIEEHAQYMWKYKHLKAVPKAKVDEKGQQMVEIGAHNKGVLKN